MTQVSKPVLIALVAAAVLLGAKFTVLRSSSGGGGSTPAPATAPGQTGLQSAVDKAHAAVGVSKQSATRHEQAAAAASGGATASSPAASRPGVTKAAKPAKPVAAAKPAKPLPKLEPGDQSGPILQDLADGKVVVALFYNPHGADDNAALRAVRSADRHNGRVIVHSIPIQDVGNYNAITAGVQVLEAPTIIVMGRGDKARTIVGYTEVKEVDQTVSDIGGRGFGAKPGRHLTGFAARASFICDGTNFGVETSGTPTSIADLQPFLTNGVRIERRDRARLAAIPARGAKQVAAKRAVLRAYDADLAAVAHLQAQLKAGAPSGPAIVELLQAERRSVASNRPALRAVGEHNCLG